MYADIICLYCDILCCMYYFALNNILMSTFFNYQKENDAYVKDTLVHVTHF